MFLTQRRPLWDGTIGHEEAGIPVRVVRDVNMSHAVAMVVVTVVVMAVSVVLVVVVVVVVVGVVVG